MKNEQEEGNIRDYSVGNVSSDMNFTLTQQNTWILAYEGFDGEGWWRVEITIWFICIVQLSIFLFRGSRCGYCSILMGAWHQGCRSVEVNIYPSAITAMPYSCFLWLLCVGNAISRNKLIVIRIYFYIIIFFTLIVIILLINKFNS